jgi:hypothetical protein
VAERIQRKRTKGWRMPFGTVYVGRPGRWGNPFSALPWLDLAESIEIYRLALQGIWNSKHLRHLDDEQFQATYTAWNTWRIHLGAGHPTEIARSELSGRDLACWCSLDQPCHADVILDVVNG